jgi:DnaJ-class molecular chaperone
MTANAPLWLIQDVQRAFRVRYHPDRHEVSGKRKAEEVFQEAEQVFAKILALRG